MCSDHIRKPDYALTSVPDTRLIPREPVIWSEVEIIRIREACQLARQGEVRGVSSANQRAVLTDQSEANQTPHLTP